MFEIDRNIDVAITLDEATFKHYFGHFRKVLIDINVSSKLQEQILVEMEGFAFLIDVEYEKIHPFCHSCQTLGDTPQNCKKKSSAG